MNTFLLLLSVASLTTAATSPTVTGGLVTSCDPDDVAIAAQYVAVGACASDDASLRLNAAQQLELCLFCSTVPLCIAVKADPEECVSPDSERSFKVLQLNMVQANASAPSINIIEWPAADQNTSCAASFDRPRAYSLDAPSKSGKAGARCVAVADASRDNETTVALYNSIDFDRSVAYVCLWRAGDANLSVDERNKSCVAYASQTVAMLRPKCFAVPIGSGTCMSVPARTGWVATIGERAAPVEVDGDGLSDEAVLAIAVTFGVVGALLIVAVTIWFVRFSAITSFRQFLRRRDAEAQADQQANAEAKKQPAVALSSD